MLLAVLCCCAKGQEPLDIGSYQKNDEYTVRVLLDDKIINTLLRIDSPYKIVNVDTMEIVPIQSEGEFLNVEIQPGGIKAGFQVFKTKRLIIEPQKPVSIKYNDQFYRGNIEFVINDDNNTPSMMIINNVSLESYLMGVVGAEMPSYWDAEALKAQAIAARTYWLYMKNKFGKTRAWDVKATQANQVYKGLSAETLRTTNAVIATNGMILCCQNESGDWEPFGTYYSSVCGGHTENSMDVFGESCPALIGVDCPYCRQIARPGVFYWPIAKFDKKLVSELLFARYPGLKELGQIEKIEVAKENNYESTILKFGHQPKKSVFKRIVSVKLIGSPQTSSAATRKFIEPNSAAGAGKIAFLRAEDLRLTLDPTGTIIQSMSCQILNTQNEIMFVSGTGFGHGVGLCQYGARQMAREGKTAQEILAYYYPNSRIKILY